MSVGAASLGPSGHRSRRDVLRLGGSLLAAGASAPLLGACARAPQDGGGSGGDGELSIYWNAGHAYAAYEAVIKQFEKDHGISVVWQKFQWPDMRTKLLADFKSGNVPDLVEDPSAWATEFAVTDNVMSLQPYIDQDGEEMGFPDDWQQATVDRYTVDGEVYGIQLHLTCQLLFYNKQMFSDAGISAPPETWDDFLAVAQELTGGDVYGCHLNQDHSYATPWQLQNGVTIFEPDGPDFLVPRQAALEALRFQQELVHKHEVSPVPTVSSDYTAPRKAMAAKQAAMIFTGPWDIAPLQEAAPDLDFGVAQALRREKQSTIVAGGGMYIPKGAKHPDLAWDLIKRLTTLETELKVTEEQGQTMPRKSWAEDPQVQGEPLVKAFAEGLTYAEDWADQLRRTGKFGAVDEAKKATYQEIVLQSQPVEGAVNNFVDTALGHVKG